MKKYFLLIVLALTIFTVACVDTKKDGQSGQVRDELPERDDSTQLTDSMKSDSAQLVVADESDHDNDVNFSPRGEKQSITTNTDFVLKDKGVDIVQIGATVNSLPDKVEGLYDQKKTVSYGTDGNAVLLYAKNEQIMELAYDDRNNKITQVRLTTPNIKTEDGVHQFMKYKTLLKIDRINRLIGQKNPNNVFDFTLDGITYELDENIRGEKYVSAIVVKK